MPSTTHVVLAALVALLVWSSLGALVLRQLVSRDLVWPFAPIVGWAVHNAIAVPVFFVLPFTATTVVALALVLVAIAAVLSRGRVEGERVNARPPLVALVLAVLLAAASASAILPKIVGDAVVLADPIFDHAKVALVDDIARLGLPPGNPFAADGGSGRLAYYYLWHFSAAELARVLSISGWEADAAMTFLSAFSSLLVMMGLAVRLSGRAMAATWVVLFAAAASLRGVAIALFGGRVVDAWIREPGGFAGWLFQSSWVPQHLAATSCVLVAVFLMTTLGARVDALRIVALGLVIAAGFETSTWIGGVVFAVAMLVVVPVVVLQADASARLRVVATLAMAGLIAAVVASPFLVDQLASSASRQGHAPVAIHPFPVVGDAVPAASRPLLDVPAYWLVLLPMELGAAYIVGLVAMRRLLRDRTRPPALAAFVALTLASLACAGWLASTLADNNDLAWRAALLASTGTIVFAAAGLAAWIADRRRAAVLAALVVLALGFPETVHLIEGNLVGVGRPGAHAFARAPELWSRVRELTRPGERVANNPYALSALTPWSVNIGWSLLADRRSCYAAWELNQVYTSVPHVALRAVDALFVRVFDGTASKTDLDAFANDFDCRIVVVTPEDGAWSRDPFADDGRYTRIDARDDAWRLYRREDR